MKTVICHAHVLTLNDKLIELEKRDILIDGSKITAIAPLINADDPDTKIIDASGMLAMPGLVNGHFHSPGNFMKGALPSLPLEIFMLYEVPPLSNQPPDPRHIYIRTMLSTLEMLKTGVTAVHDDAYYIPYPTPETIDGLMQSYADAGIRAVVTIDQPNVVEYEKYPYLYEILPPKLRNQMAQAPLTSERELLDCYEHMISKWNLSCQGRLKAGLSVSAPQRVTTSYFQALCELSLANDLPLNIHILETKLQRVLGNERYGKSLVHYIAELGFLIEQAMIIHAIWVDDNDIDLIAKAGSVIAHNPVCNLRLGSGIMQWRKIIAAGIPVCLGSDEACSDDSVNMWLVGKMAGLIHNITDPDYQNWPTPIEILEAMILGGARGMRNQKLTGKIAPGYDADIILMDLDTLAFTPLNDVSRQLVYNEIGSSVRMTMVAGDVLFENGKILTVDETAIKEEAREIMQSYQKDFSKVEQEAKILEPYYREMYLKAITQNVDMSRWVEYLR